MIHPARDIVVIGASAGGLAACKVLLRALPGNFPAAIFIALHRKPDPRDPDGLTTALATYGRRVVGVLLTGSMGDDGTAGLWQSKHRWGITIVPGAPPAPRSRGIAR